MLEITEPMLETTESMLETTESVLETTEFMLEISEIFYSLQGEGPWSGRPAVFLRLSGCIEPLCPWCDTMYACGKGLTMTLEMICEQVLSFKNHFVVITGGEPFLQWDNGLKLLEEKLISEGCEIQYETGGKVLIPASSKGTIVCSPKYIDESWQFVEENIHRAHIFKFVVSDNFNSITAFVEKYNIPVNKVWIMPLGTSREEQLALFPSLWNFCVNNRFNFSPRLHTIAFTNQRGV